MFQLLINYLWYRRPTIEFPETGCFDQDIVGESYYQESLRKISGGYTKEGHNLYTEAILVHNDGNKFDNNAIAVTINRRIVGHLSRQEAKKFRSYMERNGNAYKNVKCSALIVGGWKRGLFDKGHFGVKLDFPRDY